MASSLRILADANIPLAAEAFSRFGKVRVCAGHAITPAELAEVDVLLVRSVTKVGESLLAGSPVRFVGTATAGADHVDEEYLRLAGIGFASAPGSNATSVVEYVLAVLISVAADRSMELRGRTFGVVGCGWIGGAVAERAEALGMHVLRCDPPLHESNPAASIYVPLEEVLSQSDFVSIHTPLTPTMEEVHATYHLIGPASLAMMKPEAVLINTARGAVVDNMALKAALQGEIIGGAALDVWEGEPEIDIDLVRLARVATPHIAGYSLDGKLEGTRMLEEALRTWLIARAAYVPQAWDFEASYASVSSDQLILHALPVKHDLDDLNEVRWLNVLVRQAYNLRKDDTRFRQSLLSALSPERADVYREFRRSYPVRRTWGQYTVNTIIPEWLEEVVKEGLGMNIIT